MAAAAPAGPSGREARPSGAGPAAQSAEPAAASARLAPAGPAAGNGFLSPVVQRLLAEHGLTAGEVVGSGRDGRITRADVLAAAANRNRSAAAPSAPSPSGWPAQPADVPQPGPDDEVVEFSRARRNTATNMMRSLATSAHTLVVVEVDYHAVDAVRRAAGLSFLPFVARAVVDALGEFPHVNASVGDDMLIVHRRIHLGVAVDVDFEALVVPGGEGRRRQAPAGPLRRDRRPGRSGPAPSASPPTTSPAARSPSPTSGATAPW